MIRPPLVIVIVSCIILSTINSRASERYALVVGNGAYQSAPLKNPVNDAIDMAAVLKKSGFEVTLLKDASKREIEDAIRKLGSRLRQSGGIGLFYYAGHGIQLDGQNYLIPVDCVIESEGDVRYGAVDAGLVLSKMEDAQNDLNIVILDACRNNPFARSFRSSAPGLARMDAPKGSMVAYATAPGSVAADGDGKNGIYTKHLIDNILIPGLTMERILKNVRIAVVAETKNQQIPWESSSLMGDFYFLESTSAKNDLNSYEPKIQTSETIPVPVTTEVSFEDILSAAQAQEASKERWDAWQKKRKSDYDLVQAIDQNDDLTSNQKKEAWQRFLAVISQDNPYSTQDDDMRKVAKSKLSAWKTGSVQSANELSVEKVASDPDKNVTEPVAAKGSLFINTVPEDADVRIMNINASYYPGMELEPGRYHIRVTKGGYKTAYMLKYIQKGQRLDVDVVLDKEPPETAPATPAYQSQTLAVVTPEPAPVRIEPFDDGKHVKYENGIVYDKDSGLDWIAGPDTPMNWYQAKAWARSLEINGGGWESPPVNRLKDLYKKKKSNSTSVLSLLNTSEWQVWAKEQGNWGHGFVVDFRYGTVEDLPLNKSGERRALAIRKHKD